MFRFLSRTWSKVIELDTGVQPLVKEYMNWGIPAYDWEGA